MKSQRMITVINDTLESAKINKTIDVGMSGGKEFIGFTLKEVQLGHGYIILFRESTKTNIFASIERIDWVALDEKKPSKS